VDPVDREPRRNPQLLAALALFHNEPMVDPPNQDPLQAAGHMASDKPPKLSKQALRWLEEAAGQAAEAAQEGQRRSLAWLMSSALPNDLTNPTQPG